MFQNLDQKVTLDLMHKFMACIVASGNMPSHIVLAACGLLVGSQRTTEADLETRLGMLVEVARWAYANPQVFVRATDPAPAPVSLIVPIT